MGCTDRVTGISRCVGSCGKPATVNRGLFASLPRSRVFFLRRDNHLWRPRRSRWARPSKQPRASESASRSEEHTSELQSLMRISFAVFGLTKQRTTRTQAPPLRRELLAHAQKNKT